MAGVLKFVVIALVMVAWVISGCAATKQARTVEKLGFLKAPKMYTGRDEIAADYISGSPAT